MIHHISSRRNKRKHALNLHSALAACVHGRRLYSLRSVIVERAQNARIYAAGARVAHAQRGRAVRGVNVNVN